LRKRAVPAPRWTPRQPELRDSFITSRYDDALAWARKFAFFQCPFVTACCGMEHVGHRVRASTPTVLA
jgi:NADH:ubiquinone oxidoreductase subunit B-like Fe-S oxidoreductase